MKTKIQPHLRIGIEDSTSLAFLSGNPDRIPLIAKCLEQNECISSYRGLVTYKGTTPGGNEVLVVTTGMGGPSTAITIEELRRIGVRDFIRIGSCGGLAKAAVTGSIVVPFGAIRDEYTSLNYAPMSYPAVASPDIYFALLKAAKKRNTRILQGLVWTSDNYYPVANPDAYKKWAKLNVTSVEMESSVIFTFAQTHENLRAGSILATDGNLFVDPKTEMASEDEKTGEKNPKFQEAMDEEIQIAIAAVDLL